MGEDEDRWGQISCAECEKLGHGGDILSCSALREPQGPGPKHCRNVAGALSPLRSQGGEKHSLGSRSLCGEDAFPREYTETLGIRKQENHSWEGAETYELWLSSAPGKVTLLYDLKCICLAKVSFRTPLMPAMFSDTCSDGLFTGILILTQV